MPLAVRALALLAGALLAGGVGRAEAGLRCFGLATHPTGTRPIAVLAAELDGRPGLDLAVAASGTVDVSLLANAGDGSFSAVAPVSFRDIPSGLAGADLDGRNSDDLIVVHDIDSSLAIRMNNGDGSFQPVVRIPTGLAPRSVTVADLDGRNGPDLIVANSGDDSIDIRLNDGSGGFGPATTIPVGDRPVQVTAADLDDDGGIDLAVANADSWTISILFGTGDGSFRSGSTVRTRGGPMGSRALELDGYPGVELVAGLSNDQLAVYTNDGRGAFFAHSVRSLGNDALTFAMADLDGDGFEDAVVGNSETLDVSVLRGQPGITFGELHRLPAGGRGLVPALVVALALADLDGDGRLDLAATAPNANELWVQLQGQPARFAPPRTEAPRASTNVLLADLDGRNGSDLVYGRPGGIYVQFNIGGGALDPAVQAVPATNINEIGVADLDRRNGPDLVATSIRDSTLVVALNNGDGSFAPATAHSTGVIPTGIGIADFDGINGMDLIVGDGDLGAKRFWLFLNNGDGTLAAPSTWPARDGCCSFAVADFDGLPGLDVVAAGNGIAELSRNRGDGSFRPPLTLPVSPLRPPMLGEDFDGVQGPDLLVSEYGALKLWLNDGAGSFSGPRTIPVGSAPVALARADVDGANDLDLVVVDGSSSETWILLEDGSGGYRVDRRLPAGPLARSVVAGDVDGDARTDLAVGHSRGALLFSACSTPRWVLRNDETIALASFDKSAIFTGTGALTLDRDGPDGQPGRGEGTLRAAPGSADDDDAYDDGFASPWSDPDPIVSDTTRPLVVWQVEGAGAIIQLVKSAGGQVRIQQP